MTSLRFLHGGADLRTARSLLSCGLLAIVGLLLLACSGKEEAPAAEGAASPEAAVRSLLAALVANDREAMLNSVASALRIRPTASLFLLLESASSGDQVFINGLETRTERGKGEDEATVYVSALIRTDGIDERLDNVAFPTVRIDGRWLVSSKLAPAMDWEMAQLDRNPSLPGVYVRPHPGPDGLLGTADDRGHVGAGANIPICPPERLARGDVSNPFCYLSNPPTSGVHGASVAPFGVLTSPATKESLVHNMEHGGVVIWYNTSNRSVIDQLASITNESLGQRLLVVMSAYPGMEPETIALTAWTRLEKFTVAQFTPARVRSFIASHNKRFNPEGF